MAAITSIACGSGISARPRPDGGAVPDAGGGAVDASVVEVGIGPWTGPPDGGAPVPLDDVTVYAFSQTYDGTPDPQVVTLAPDMNIRAWQRWDKAGVTNDFDVGYVNDCHAAGTRFIGGTTATALFPDEFPNAQFPALSVDDVDTRDASGAPVVHPQIPQMHRGSLANPAYRAYLIQLSEIQIDDGVDGLFFDEINGDDQGAAYDGNEGFDAAHLADFNAYLLWRFPGADYQSMFKMTAENLLTPGVPAGDLTRNFNYQKYLVSNGWAASPFAAANPLASVWGKTIGNRPAPGATDFVDTAEPYRYWGQIAGALRAYAQEKHGRQLLLTSNGVWPLVDFQSVGLYGGNQDDAGGLEAEYVPVTAGSTTSAAHLDGTRILQRPFRNLKARSEALAPGAPVVLFIDWPTNFMSYLLHMPASEQQDYWRIYAAEAYANGLFFAFHLQDSIGDPTATQLGWMPLFQGLTAFYRSHQDLYHGVAMSTASATSSLTTPIMISVTAQATPRRLLVHLVNHDYAGALNEHDGFTVTVQMPQAPISAILASPDLPADAPLTPTYDGQSATVTVPALAAYDVIELAY